MAEKTLEDVEHETARLAHAYSNRMMEAQAGMTVSFGNAAVRAPALAAAGEIAALLGFYSANSPALRGSPALADFNSALLWFFGAVLACVVAPGAAYASQSLFVFSDAAEEHHIERSFIRRTRRSKIYRTVGIVCQAVAVLLTAGAIVSLVLGGLAFMRIAAFIETFNGLRDRASVRCRPHDGIRLRGKHLGFPQISAQSNATAPPTP